MMKATLIVIIACTTLAVAFSLPSNFRPRPRQAQPCRNDSCLLPNCRCSTQEIPGNFTRLNTPQLVFLSFDDAITVTNYPLYEELGTRQNKNGQGITLTFFVTHEYTNYSLVNNLWQRGHDIAVHSITHVSNTTYWRELNQVGWTQEIMEQRYQLSRLANIPQNDIKGMRAPFLQTGGNTMYRAITNGMNGSLTWDCSLPTQTYRIPGLWPYTNDYQSIQDCSIPPCPTDPFPGFWTVPMIDLIGDDGSVCAMADECTPVPQTRNATYNLLLRNFEEHYNGNRAPFGVFVHAGWLVGNETEFEERKTGYLNFVDAILRDYNDVFIVGISQGLEWIKNPVAVTTIDQDYDPWKDVVRNGTCPFPRNCRYSNGTWERFMSSCIPCPTNYPWVGNPMGNIILEYD